MQYLGGKSKIRKELSKFLESVRLEGQTYFEPFCGGGWVLQEMSGKRVASDGNKALIAMYLSLQDGWIPPEFVSEEQYKQVKLVSNINDPLYAFCGFGVSFAGKWWGGYARSSDKVCYAATSKRSLLKQLPLIRDVEFVQGLYNEHSPEGMLIYCDPPYANTTQYGAFDGFDHKSFWDKMREWSKCNTVVVSEYEAPEDFICVTEFVSQMGMSVGDKETRPKRVERVFMQEDQARKFGLV